MNVSMWNFKAYYSNADALTRNCLLNSFTNLFCKKPKTLVFIIINIKNVICFLLWNNKGVSFYKRADVKKSKIAFIFRYFIARYFAFNYFRKYCRHLQSS